MWSNFGNGIIQMQSSLDSKSQGLLFLVLFHESIGSKEMNKMPKSWHDINGDIQFSYHNKFITI